MWKDIPGWETKYECNEFGEIRNKVKGNVRTLSDNGTGYKKITLYDKNHDPPKQKFYIHRLVATLFLNNPNMFPEVDHIDCNPGNNHVSNLEWVSKIENELRSHKFGSKLYKPFIIEYQDGRKQTFENCRQAAAELNCSRKAIDLWLKRSNRGYMRRGIQDIYYKQ